MNSDHWLKHIGKKTFELILVIVGMALHLLSFFVLYRSFLPVAKWYWEAVPIRGVDLLNASTYTAYLSRHFATIQTAWKYIWFAGHPLMIDYPSLHFYLALPLVNWFTPIQAIQLWMLVSTFLFFLFSYLLYFRLSHSRAFSLVLVVLSIYSVGVYGALIWGGSIPYYGTQFFLPLTLYLLVSYLQTDDKRWFAGAALAFGLSWYGHPQVALSYGLAFVVISMILAPRAKKVKFSKRITDTVLFLFLVFILGLPVLSGRLKVILRMPEQILSGLSGEIPISYQATQAPDVPQEIRDFYQTRIYQFYTDTHPWLLWISLGSVLAFVVYYFLISFVRVLINKRKKTSAVFILFWSTLLLGYTVGYLYLYSIGIDLFHGGWFRVFWTVPLLVGMIAAVAAGYIGFSVKKREEYIIKLIWLLVDGVFVIVVLSLTVFISVDEFKNTLYEKSAVSGGFPGGVLVAVDEADQEKWRQIAVPEWLPVDSKDYRLYNADQTYNMWFNAFYDMPLARGYVDPPAKRWGIFLMDILLDRDVAVEEFEYAPEMAEKAARFILDWNAIGYYAGENRGLGSGVTNKLSSYIDKLEYIENDEIWVTKGVKDRKPGDVTREIFRPELENKIRYVAFSKEITNPILSLSDSPAILFLGDDSAWEVFIRTLAQMGINSNQLIPVKGPRLLDELSANDLGLFDGVFMYRYDYRNHGKVWGLLTEYVENGGLLFVDTGLEVKESASIDLPAPFPKELPPIFPVEKTNRGNLGDNWNIEAASELSGIDFNSFSPLVYEDGPWQVSFAEESDVEERANLLLMLNGKAVVASWLYGQGRVVWSGLNLPAHMEMNRNTEEAVLLKRLIENLAPDAFSEAEREIGFSSEFISPEKRIISGNGKSVIFREMNFPGWVARLKSSGKSEKLKIWKTGIGDPGMMWARIPKAYWEREVKIEFRFRGALLDWLKYIPAVLLAIILFDEFAFNGFLFGNTVAKLGLFFKKRVGKWWEHEELD